MMDTSGMDPHLYTRHTAYSDPGEYSELLRALPTGIPELAAIARNVIVHYRAGGVDLPPGRLAEVDLRWLERILAADQRRHDAPLDKPRQPAERVAGCCRDHTLLTVAALREQGVPARSRVGFAAYFRPDFHVDHVIAEYWNGERWVWADPELDPADEWAFDPCDIPPQGQHFTTAATVWTAFRRGEIDPSKYGVAPDLPIRGDWFIYDYVLHELAHRRGDELLLWDDWGAMTDDLADADLELADEVAKLLLAADTGDSAAEQELIRRYAGDPRLHPGDRVRSFSPLGKTNEVDLRRSS